MAGVDDLKEAMLRRTPLFAAHQRSGGKLIEFGGWEMPVQYSSIVDEHLCVRRASGVFDISHMGEVFVNGSAAAQFLNLTLTNDVNRLDVGAGQYSQMCREDGGTVDDLYVYRIAPLEYLLIVNASRIEVDVAWLRARLGLFPMASSVALVDASDAWGAVAVQGPRVIDFIDRLFPGGSQAGTQVTAPTGLVKNQIGAWNFGGATVWLARTGYTGEDGFEIVAPAEVMEALWIEILAIGHVGCIQPCGLGARDTLRTEVCYPLYGHELDERTSPIEAGLGFFVAFDKGDFVGRTVLAAHRAGPLQKKLVAFRMIERSAPPRPSYPIRVNGLEVGTVASGTQSPSLSVGIGLGYIPPEMAVVGTCLAIGIRGREYAAEVVKKPIYRRSV